MCVCVSLSLLSFISNRFIVLAFSPSFLPLDDFVAHGSAVTCLALGQKSGRVMVTGGDDAKVNLWAVGKPNCIMVSEESDGDVHGRHSLASEVDDLVGNFSRDSFRQFQLFTKYYCFPLKWKCTMICFSAMKMVMCCSFLVTEKTVQFLNCYRKKLLQRFAEALLWSFLFECVSAFSVSVVPLARSVYGDTLTLLAIFSPSLSFSFSLHFIYLFTYSQPHTVQSCPCSACTHTLLRLVMCLRLPACLTEEQHQQTQTDTDTLCVGFGCPLQLSLFLFLTLAQSANPWDDDQIEWLPLPLCGWGSLPLLKK